MRVRKFVAGAPDEAIVRLFGEKFAGTKQSGPHQAMRLFFLYKMMVYRNSPAFRVFSPGQPRKRLCLLALLAAIVESITSPQQVHFHASKDFTKS